MPKRPQHSRHGSSLNPRTAKKPKQTVDDDFFNASDDEELLSSEDDDGVAKPEYSAPEENQEDAETADEKRLRVAKAYLEEIRNSTKHLEGDVDEDVDEEEKRREDLGARDSLVADLLQQAQLEESGRVQRKLASRISEHVTQSEGKRVGRRHRQSVTAVALSEDDSRGFAASKDGLIVHWDIETGSSDVYSWPKNDSNKVVVGARGKIRKPSRTTLALAVSSDSRYLATGGLDRTVHLWDTRTREHLQGFPGHKGAVSSLVFRQGTQQLMSAGFDRTIKLWSVEDRSYIDTLYGHQSEVLTIDCLRQERVLSVGRDRTLRIWKIPDETQLVFRGHAASMECCCFLTNSEFVSGSDDGSVALWNVMKKKPVAIMKNAHGYVHDNETPCNGNGNSEEHQMKHVPAKMNSGAQAWVSALAVCRGSDLAASGAGDGKVQLWALEEENRRLRALHSLPVKGFANSLAFAKSGRFLLVGVGQEPRLGRWERNQQGRNGVILHSVIAD